MDCHADTAVALRSRLCNEQANQSPSFLELNKPIVSSFSKPKSETKPTRVSFPPPHARIAAYTPINDRK